MRFGEWLMEPEVKGCPVDGDARLHAHQAVLNRKDIMREVFQEFHQQFFKLEQQFCSCDGLRVELGSGVFPVKRSDQDVISSDIVPSLLTDMVLDAGAMDLPNSSVKVFYLQNVFHHLPDPQLFFNELQRVLKPSGCAIVIDPASGPLASLIYPRLFSNEGYDKEAPSWRAEVTGPMSGANQALSHVVFKRDLALFLKNNPSLSIAYADVMTNWIRYLLSGGLNFRPIFPVGLRNMLRVAENFLRPLRSILGLHSVYVIKKNI